MWPAPNQEYIPLPFKYPAPMSIEEVREHGVVVAISEDGTKATVEVRQGLVISFVAVTLDSEGKILEFVVRPFNKYAKCSKAATAGEWQLYRLEKEHVDSPPISED